MPENHHENERRKELKWRREELRRFSTENRLMLSENQVEILAEYVADEVAFARWPMGERVSA